MANPYAVIPQGDITQGLAGLSSVLQENRERTALEAQENEAQALRQAQADEIQAAVNTNNPTELAKLSVKYPTLRNSLKDLTGAVNEEQETQAIDFMTSVMANPQDAEGQYIRRIEQLQAEGRDPSHTIQSLEDYQNNPEAELKQMKMLYAGLDPKGFQALEKEKEERVTNIGNVSPKDFTVESLAKYAETGKIGDLTRYTPKVKDINNIPHQYNPESLKWEPLVDMRSTAISDQSKAAVELKADEQSRLDFEKQRSAWQKKESGSEIALASAESKHTLLETTANKIRELQSGWTTEYGALLSGLPATESKKMKGLLDTILANSAFNTLVELKAAGGTLGAISEAELVLLKAKLGSLDQTNDSVEQMRIVDLIVSQNAESIARSRNGFNKDKGKYGSSFEQAKRLGVEEASEELTDEDLLNKYLQGN